jgi:glycerol uptake facilitator-like aquaporin
MLFKEGSAHWVRNFAMAFAIIIFQGAGAAAGFGICLGGFAFEKSSDTMKNIPAKDYYIAQLCPANGCNDDSIVLKVAICEATMTFLFVNFVLMVVKHNGAADMPINALAIGIALFLAIREASGISGGCINPAVGLVQSVFQMTINSQVYPNADKTSLMYAGVYVASTLGGGFMAGIFHKWFHERAIASAQNAKDSEYENMVNN